MHCAAAQGWPVFRYGVTAMSMALTGVKAFSMLMCPALCSADHVTPEAPSQPEMWSRTSGAAQLL